MFIYIRNLKKIIKNAIGECKKKIDSKNIIKIYTVICLVNYILPTYYRKYTFY